MGELDRGIFEMVGIVGRSDNEGLGDTARRRSGGGSGGGDEGG
jgi:hypothetical protein